MPFKDLIFVLLQFILLVLFILMPGFTIASGFWQQTVAFILVVSGLIFSAAALYSLGTSLSPFPTPRSGTKLVTSGVYKYIRHPIYSGIILIVLGISIYTMHVPRLLISICLLVLFWLKSTYEETLLSKRFPGYNTYMETTGRFLPRIKVLRKLLHN